MKKIILLVLSLLVFSVGVFGDYTDCIGYWSMDNSNTTATEMLDLSSKNRDGTLHNVTIGVTGKINEAYNYNGTTDYVSWPDNTWDDVGGSFTLGMWINVTDSTDYHAIFSYGDRADVDFLGVGAGDKIYFDVIDEGQKWGIYSNINITLNDWQHIIWAQDDILGPDMYINGNKVKTIVRKNAIDNTTTFPAIAHRAEAGCLGVNCRSSKTSYFKKSIDEFGFWNYTFSANNVSDLWNNGDGFNPFAEAPPSDTLDLSSPVPINNSVWNVGEKIYFDLTANASNNFDCSLLVNDAINQTITGYAAGTNVDVSFNETFSEGGYSFFISCNDGAITENTSLHYFTVSLGNITGFGLADRIAIWNANYNITYDTNLYWDFVHHRLGIGTTSPSHTLDVDGNVSADYFIGDGSLLTGISDTWWPLLGVYLYDNSNKLALNETKLNATIDARDSDTTYSESDDYLTLTDTVFGFDETKLNTTIDARSSFPSPDYNSGWVNVSQNQFQQLNYDLGGDPDDYLVDVTAKNDETDINNLYSGLDKDSAGNVRGWYYLYLNTSSITLYRATNDVRAPQLRVRIWKY